MTNKSKKIGIWIVLILTSLALIIPSVALVYNLIMQSHKTPVSLNSDDIKVSIQTAAPTAPATDGSSTTAPPTPSVSVSSAEIGL